MLATLVASATLAFTPNIEAAREYAAERPGTVAFAVRTEDGFWGVSEPTACSRRASVLKAMLLVAYAQDARDRPLRRDERALLAPMVRRSDNAPRDAIFTRARHRPGSTSGARRRA